MLNKKRLLLLSCTSVPLIPLMVSCANMSNENKKKLTNLIDPNNDVSLIPINKQEQQTENILDDLLKKVFKSNNVAKTLFLKKQNDKQHQQQIVEEIKAQKVKYIANPNDEHIRYEVINKLTKIYSDNWYFVLKNFTKFEGIFHEWFILEEQNGNKLSDEYLNNLKTLEKPKILTFENNFIDNLEEGEESAEDLDNIILYLLKNNMVMRFKIANERSESPQMILSPLVWYFEKAQTDKLSLKFISNIIHSAVVHGFEDGYIRFEQDMVKKWKYGEPSVMLLVGKDE
ncbi:aromatic motif membrane protein [[Mycoplasma] anseris]|uniref:Lipoprotein n=1 Tax=[Mycoplasma] anseris TaxID=92400 RepID=A0A2Z4NC92_9BACT|nr:aromatic motif membrane protein [[Mycoplasma] anseris]AWX69162.1 hypothetical protein DP065_00030 [[Mycoplasma] anseris]